MIYGKGKPFYMFCTGSCGFSRVLPYFCTHIHAFPLVTVNGRHACAKQTFNITCRKAFNLKTNYIMWMIMFLILPLAGLTYVLWHVWCILPFANTVKCTVLAVCILLFSATFLNFSHVTERIPLRLAQACYEVGTSTVFVLLYLVMMFLLLDVARLTHIIPRSWLYSNGYAALAVAVVTAVIFAGGYANYMHKRRHTADMPAAKTVTRDIKVVMMSDLHLGYHNRRTELARWVDIINGEQPDLVLIAGDIVDGSLRPIEEEGMAEEMRRIKAPVYACPGNHEYYAGIDASMRFYREAGITLLRDSVAVAGDIAIVGRDDRANPHRKSIGALMRGVDKSKYIILLDHQPYHLEQAEHAEVDFQLSGHTHHGQLWPISWITDAIYEDAYGPWRRGNTRYYVSSGMGIWGGKFRIGTCSEYVVGTIHAEKKTAGHVAAE